MLDFGPTAVAETDFTQSPYHSALSGAGTTWNTSIVGDRSSGLYYDNGDAATGVSLDVGVSDGSTTTINLGTNTFNTTSLTGTATNTGVYAGTSSARDGLFTNNSSNPFIGVQIGGLSTGTYEIYITGRNTNTGDNQAAYSQTVYAGTSADAGNFDFSDYSANSATLSFPSGPTSNFTSAWVENQNFVKLSITLNAGEYLNIAVAGGGGGNAARGFINSIQVVSVIPEPGAYAALGGLAALGAASVRRRR